MERKLIWKPSKGDFIQRNQNSLGFHFIQNFTKSTIIWDTFDLSLQFNHFYNFNYSKLMVNYFPSWKIEYFRWTTKVLQKILLFWGYICLLFLGYICLWYFGKFSYLEFPNLDLRDFQTKPQLHKLSYFKDKKSQFTSNSRCKSPSSENISFQIFYQNLNSTKTLENALEAMTFILLCFFICLIIYTVKKSTNSKVTRKKPTIFNCFCQKLH